MAKLLKPDHSRRIELAGVGPVQRPVDIDRAQTGFSALRTLRIYRFDPPAAIEGHAEEEEVFIVVLAGEIELRLRSDRWKQNDARFHLEAADSGGPCECAAYLPPHAEYTLTPRTAADVAYARALPTGAPPPAVFSSNAGGERAGPRVLLDSASYAQRLRFQLWQVQTREADAELVPMGWTMPDGEALIHVRSAPARTAAAHAPGLPGVALDSWDTLAIFAGESPRIRVGAQSSAVGLMVSAA